MHVWLATIADSEPQRHALLGSIALHLHPTPLPALRAHSALHRFPLPSHAQLQAIAQTGARSLALQLTTVLQAPQRRQPVPRARSAFLPPLHLSYALEAAGARTEPPTPVPAARSALLVHRPRKHVRQGHFVSLESLLQRLAQPDSTVRTGSPLHVQHSSIAQRIPQAQSLVQAARCAAPAHLNQARVLQARSVRMVCRCPVHPGRIVLQARQWRSSVPSATYAQHQPPGLSLVQPTATQRTRAPSQPHSAFVIPDTTGRLVAHSARQIHIAEGVRRLWHALKVFTQSPESPTPQNAHALQTPPPWIASASVIWVSRKPPTLQPLWVDGSVARVRPKRCASMAL